MALGTGLPTRVNQGLLWQGLTLRLPQGVLVGRLVETLTLCVFIAETLDTKYRTVMHTRTTNVRLWLWLQLRNAGLTVAVLEVPVRMRVVLARKRTTLLS